MRIEYRILWLDDKIDDFINDEFIEDIEKYIEEEGFSPKIFPVKTHDDFFDKLDNNYDLILTDYHMDGMNGEEVVRKVRTKSVLTEILFYTARADLKDAKKIDRVSFLETRGNDEHEEAVVKKLKALIDLTIIKFQDIIAMRGMIMHETTDLDAQQIEVLKCYIDEKDANDIDELKNNILTKINTLYTSKLSKVNGEWKTKENGFQKLMKDNFVFSADYKIETLSQILSELLIDDFSLNYKEEIIKVRNKFAHAKLEMETDANGKVIRKYFKHGKDGITFDAEYCKIIRKNIRKHKDNLDTVSEKLNER